MHLWCIILPIYGNSDTGMLVLRLSIWVGDGGSRGVTPSKTR